MMFEEKLSDADLIAAVRICCGPVEYTSCDECPAHEWCSETHKDIMCELEDRLSDLRTDNQRLRDMWADTTKKLSVVQAERDAALEKLSWLEEKPVPTDNGEYCPPAPREGM